MDIYSILASKPHNPHYLIKYITFIKKCQLKNNRPEFLEKHHICPKAKDMFPEYKSFTENEWNKVLLSSREHFIAHLILWKAFPNFNSQLIALNLMKKNKEIKNSKLYQIMRDEYRLMMKNKANEPNFHLKGRNNPCHEKNKNGTHIFLSDDFKKKTSKRMQDNNPMRDLEARKKVSEKLSGKKGRIHTKETKNKISESRIGSKNPNYGKKGCFDHLNNKKIKCPHCKIITTPGNAKRWHLDNCKRKNL